MLLYPRELACLSFFFFNDTATTEIYTLSLHDALPIFKLIQASAVLDLTEDDFDFLTSNKIEIIFGRSEERFSRNAETDLVCRLLLEKKNRSRLLPHPTGSRARQYKLP